MKIELCIIIICCYFKGNVLINVGPTKEGIIVPIFEERLLQLGEWLDTNGEAIYNTSAWFYQRDSVNSDVWYTCHKQYYDAFRLSNVPNKHDSILAVYAIFLKWPIDHVLNIKDVVSYISKNEKCKISFLLPGNYIILNVSLFIKNFNKMVKVSKQF